MESTTDASRTGDMRNHTEEPAPGSSDKTSTVSVVPRLPLEMRWSGLVAFETSIPFRCEIPLARI